MGLEGIPCSRKAILHVHEIAGHMTELLEIHAESPTLHIVFIPGNPGIISFYQDYVEELYRCFDGKVSITGIGHIAHTTKDWEGGRLFSLEEQIVHKVQFIEREICNAELPLVLVGHSIGSYIALCILKRLSNKLQYVVGLYPFLTTNTKSSYQAFLGWCSRIWVLREALSGFATFLGFLPQWSSKNLVKALIGRKWSSNSINVAVQYLFKYSVVRNCSYMGMTEFTKLKEDLDWLFIKDKQNKISLLFGIDDHWGPLSLFEQICFEAPKMDLATAEKNHAHAFCCTRASSEWVAAYTASRILLQISKPLFS
eukprot:c19998_g1_i1 orf=202-1137(+)